MNRRSFLKAMLAIPAALGCKWAIASEWAVRESLMEMDPKDAELAPAHYMRIDPRKESEGRSREWRHTGHRLVYENHKWKFRRGS